ncbi:sodium:solute symporter [Stenotrophomonas nitritireducens]|uniref:Sodium:solute symporter n=1 Tax=Stenotrophomonas nitritireducens TaxID=83617 RepID=A0ABR5NP55_9GAMM|nr:sodium:solute symporter [Stenotrophomonas nitritireducens]KRG60523.1 sodium:solute symporter [Stenotrophomonas nitritireducens]
MSIPAAVVPALPLPRRALRGLRLLATLALLALGGTAAAENLSTVTSGSLAPLPADAAQPRLLAVDGHDVALSAGKAWTLTSDGKAWQPLALAPAGATADIRTAVSAGGQAWLLRGTAADSSDRLQSARLQGDTLALGRTLALPVALGNAQAAALGDVLYVAGTAADGSMHLYRHALAAEAGGWQAQPVWPADGRLVALQGQKGGLYAVLGDVAGDALWRWTVDNGWQAAPAPGGHILPGSLRALGQAHLLMLVRDATGTGLRTFHTITSAWATLDTPAGAAAPAPLDIAARGNGLAWTSADGGVHFAEVQGGKHLLGWLDWSVIVVYLIGMIGIGVYFYLKDQTASESEFFVGGRSIPFWAAGISLYATNTSSISFIAIPAKAYETNWQYLTNNLVAVLGLMFVAVWIVPLLRRLDLMSVFSYLETRFHPAIRMLASALAIAMQIGSRLSVILFLPALAIATITGIDVVWSILIMGVFTIIYTVMGGMRAVVWTDFVQVFVKMGGAIFAIGFIVWTLGADFDGIREAAMAEHKTKLLDFSFDLTKATVWGFIFLVVFDVVLTFPKDQVLMQRTLATKSDKEAGRSIWIFAAIMIPGGFIFYSIGTALWMYYKHNPGRLDPLLPIDATFPLFIAAELPPGVTGLIIAGIFAAAMSTLSSIINSVATLLSVDFYDKLAKNPSERGSVRFAEIMTVVVGLAGMGLALVLSRYDIHSLFDVSIELAGLLGGGFAGAYTLGMFTRRANSPGVAIGIAGSIALTLLAWSFKLVHPYFYLGISILLCIVIGYLASLCFPAPARSLKGLTIYRQDAT